MNYVYTSWVSKTLAVVEALEYFVVLVHYIELCRTNTSRTRSSRDTNLSTTSWSSRIVGFPHVKLGIVCCIPIVSSYNRTCIRRGDSLRCNDVIVNAEFLGLVVKGYRRNVLCRISVNTRGCGNTRICRTIGLFQCRSQSRSSSWKRTNRSN